MQDVLLDPGLNLVQQAITCTALSYMHCSSPNHLPAKHCKTNLQISCTKRADVIEVLHLLCREQLHLCKGADCSRCQAVGRQLNPGHSQEGQAPVGQTMQVNFNAMPMPDSSVAFLPPLPHSVPAPLTSAHFPCWHTLQLASTNKLEH